MDYPIKIIEEIKNRIIENFPDTKKWSFINHFKKISRNYDDKYGFDITYHDRKYIVYYWTADDTVKVKSYEFKLPQAKKYDKWAIELNFKEWLKNIESKIYTEDEIKNHSYFHSSLIEWINKSNQNHPIKNNITNGTIDKQPILFWRDELGKLYCMKLKLIMEELTLDSLYLLANQKSLEFWNRKFTGKIIIHNKKWKRLAGQYRPSTKTIELSNIRNNQLGVKESYDMLLHELVHWHLHTSNTPYDDTDKEFIEECLKWNIGLSYANDAKIAYKNYKNEINRGEISKCELNNM